MLWDRMRICLVVHGFPPHELAGVEAYTLGLARALAARGERVEVLALCRDRGLPDRSLRRQERDGFALHWLNSLRDPKDPAEALEPPGLAERFGQFLDREQPEVVHFQHVVKLGLGLIEAALERRIPTLYTAHDYFPVCHRISLLRPDLQRCATLGQPAQCTRCDLALGWLNRQPGLGDYQLGVRPEMLAPEAARGLAAILAGQPEQGPLPVAEWEAALVRRYDLDLRRSQVFGRLERILAPTEFLARQLAAGGLDPARIRHLPYGIEVRGLTELPAPNPVGRALVLGYVGSATKHKGVDVLLEAFARLQADPARRGRFALELFGDSTDRVFVEALERRARELGAIWNGAYDPSQLPAVLGRLDLLVVPSIWVENQPLVIREAFAARRPVVASRVGALPESVRDGVDGLLFEPGDAADLAATLARLLDEPELYGRLQRGIPAVKTSAQQADELLAEYRSLIAASQPRSDLAWSRELPHLGPLAERHAALSGLPLRDLFAQSLAGLERLRGLFGLEPQTAPELLAGAFGPRSRIQELLRDQAAELEHLRSALQGRQSAEGHLERENRYLRDELESRSAELAGRARQVEQLDAEKRREREWLDGLIVGLERERDWLKGQMAGLESERDWLRGQWTALQKERDWLKGEVDSREAELVWRRGQVQDFERALGEREAASKDIALHLAELQNRLSAAALEEQERQALASSLSAAQGEAQAARRAIEQAALRSADLLGRLGAVLGRGPAAGAVPAGRDGAGSPALPGADAWPSLLAELEAGLVEIERELAWRREQMAAASAELGGGARRWLAGAAGRRLADWKHLGQPGQPGPADGGGGASR
jgi:glycosyltransferase involved in cell wall biosynthesis